jgi:hypothetical protein
MNQVHMHAQTHFSQISTLTFQILNTVFGLEEVGSISIRNLGVYAPERTERRR